MCVRVCAFGKARLKQGERLLYLGSLTVQPSSLLPLSSGERSAEYGKSEAAAYCRKALEKVGRSPVLCSVLCLRDPFGD